MDTRLKEVLMRKTFPVLVLMAGIALMVALLTLVGCRRSSERKTVAVTFAPQADVARALGDGRYEVVTLIKPSTNPETYDPSMNEMTALQQSGLYMSLGTPGFEQATLPRLVENFPGLEVVDVAGGVTAVEGTHGHGEGDPHLWSSVRNMKVIASSMAEALASYDTDDTEGYRERESALQTRLQALDDSLATILEPVRGATFVVVHPSLSYFARDYGLNQFSLEREGKEPTARQMQQRLDSAAAARPLLMIAEPSHNPDQAWTIARQLGIDTIQVQLNAADWTEQLTRLAYRLAEAGARQLSGK
ncbi:MAG: zinc ABC transporter substrate-binding protein [Muribaculaceae bacterium]|nr:zinc ABC transporter substrate-binding protein [Muribaculaceae bacterium]MDE7189904.1 zinc ABC transporter substrate-binding protein [Muribaculaceae bacterium]